MWKFEKIEFFQRENIHEGRCFCWSWPISGSLQFQLRLFNSYNLSKGKEDLWPAEMTVSPGIKPQKHVDMAYISIETVIALASVLGNVLVVLAVCMNRALRNTTFCFIVSLAVADIAVGALVIPLAVVISQGINTDFYTCLFLSCLLLIITQSSILSLLAIAIDRYLRVKIPTRWGTATAHFREYFVTLVRITVCWMMSAVMKTSWKCNCKYSIDKATFCLQSEL